MNNNTSEQRIPLVIAKDDVVFGQPGENMNTVVIGPPGCGKTISNLVPTIIESARQGCSMIIDDKKGNIRHKVNKILIDAGYKILDFDLINLTSNFGFNPLEGKKTIDDFKEVLDIIVNPALLNGSGDYVYWAEEAKNYLVNICRLSYLVYKKNNDFAKVLEIMRMTHLGSNKPISAMEDEDERLIKEKAGRLILELQKKGVNDLSFEVLKKFILYMPDRTAQCIESNANSMISFINSQAVLKIICGNNYDFTKIGKEKTALFITTSDTETSKYMIAKALYKYLSNAIYSYADLKCEDNNNMTQVPVRFILDDFASGCRENDIECKLANCRSRNISYILSFQSIAQLQSIYRDSASTILDCCPYKLYYGSTNLNTISYLSTLLDIPSLEIKKMKKEDVVVCKPENIPSMKKRVDISKYEEEIRYSKLELI